MGKVGINLGGWYGIYLGDKGSLFVYIKSLGNLEFSYLSTIMQLYAAYSTQ